MKNHPKFITNIDWDLFKNQREYLYNLPVNENIEGIISLCDAICDYAVDEMGLDENNIYLKN